MLYVTANRWVSAISFGVAISPGNHSPNADDARDLAYWHLRESPRTRAVWIQADNMLTTEDNREFDSFYEVIHWLNSDDPWVIDAYTRYTGRKAARAGDAATHALSYVTKVERYLENSPDTPWVRTSTITF